jgi:hypothetical protein
MSTPDLSASMTHSGVCALGTAFVMILLSPAFRWRPETTFLGGFVGAILFFFFLIFVGNFREKKKGTGIGWIFIGLCEAVAITVSLVIHPVCVTTCLLFSIPVIIYVKRAAAKMKSGSLQ